VVSDDGPSVVNCDAIHTVAQRRLDRRVGTVADELFEDICDAIAVAVGCDRPRARGAVAYSRSSERSSSRG